MNNQPTDSKQPQESQHQFVQNKKYYTISIYTIAVILICALVAKLIFSWSTTSAIISKYISALYPIIFGFLIAYMLNPLVNLFERKVFGNLCKIKSNSVCKVLAIIISYILLLGLLFIVVLFLAPQMYSSIKDLVVRAQEWYSSPTSAGWVVSLQEMVPTINVAGIMDTVKDTVATYLQTDNLGEKLSTWMPTIFSTASTLFSVIYNIVFSFIVSVYVIIDKKRIIRNIKRFIRAIFKPNKARFINHKLKEVHGIFSGFIIGKTIDSLIIGGLCFILTTCFGLPYALLISLIVGITNMVPYVGPFVGAIPGIIIILMINPLQALIFLILVCILQWFDGFYLGPKILGVSTGLRPVWIIFALCVGGAAAGVMGMFLGVPFVASIALLLDQWIDYKCAKKGTALPAGEEDLLDAVTKANEEDKIAEEKELGIKPAPEKKSKTDNKKNTDSENK